MPDIESIAAAIHESWRALSRTAGWSIPSHLNRPYADLCEADQDDNRAAARRMGEVLSVAGLALSDDPTRQEVPLPEDLEAMAESEHRGWVQQRAQTGWSWAATRDDSAKHHPAMVPYANLPEPEKEKDRQNIRHYPEYAARAGLHIVRAG